MQLLVGSSLKIAQYFRNISPVLGILGVLVLFDTLLLYDGLKTGHCT